MLSPRSLMFFSVLVTAPNAAHAFDPFTIAKGAEAASGLVGGMDKLDDAADIGFAFSDLLTELDVDPKSEEEVNSTVHRLEDLNAQMSELRQAKQDTQSLLDPELNRAKSFADQIRHVRQMISMSKKIATLLGLRPKAANSALQLQQTRLNYMMLDEMTGLRRLQFEQLLKERETEASYRLVVARVANEEERAKSKGGSR